jgi:hypothetical protein
MLFDGMTVLLGRGVEGETEDLLAANGAATTATYNERVTMAVVPGNGGDAPAAAAKHEWHRSIAAFKRVRGQQLPVMRAPWVAASVAAGQRLDVTAANTAAYSAYNPTFLRGVTVCTTQLDAHLRGNVRDAAYFFGGMYDAELTASTTVVVVPTGVVSAKMTAAREHAIPCEPMRWLQGCIDQTRLLPFSRQNANDMAIGMLQDLLAVPAARAPRNDNNTTPAKGGIGAAASPVSTRPSRTSQLLTFLSPISQAMSSPRRGTATLRITSLPTSPNDDAVDRKRARPTTSGDDSSEGPITRGRAAQLSAQKKR